MRMAPLLIEQFRAMRHVAGNLRKIINHHGGVKGTLTELFRNDEIKHGELVGEDKFGNKYYENNDYFYLRNRWFRPSDKYGYDYDATNIPPEWHRWMHHGTDIVPSRQPRNVERWQTYEDPTTKTGTLQKYVPYTTTEPKIQPWTPPPPKK